MSPARLAALLADPADALHLPANEAAALLARVGALEAVLRARVAPGPPSNGTGLLTVQEVADVLAVKPSTIRAYAERGKIPCVRIGGRLRFRRSDVDLWITRRHEKGGA